MRIDTMNVSGEMGSPHYSLRWNNHQSHILHAFDTLLQSEALVDVTLVCEETSFKAHKVVLSACSPYFQRIFCETPCKHPVIVLKDLKGWEVQAIVDFMYRGEISVGQEQLASLIRAAESLQVRGLAHTEPIPMDSKENNGRGSTPSYSPAPSVSMFPSQPHTPQSAQFDPRVSSHINFADSIGDHHRQCSSPTPRRKQARPRRRSGESLGPQDLRKGSSPIKESCDGAENLCIKRGSSVVGQNAAIPPARPNSTPTASQFMPLKMETEDCGDMSPQTQPVELTTTPSDHLREREKERDRDRDRERDRDKEREKEISRHDYPHPPPNNIDSLSHLAHHETSPLENPSFPHLASISALSLTPPHMFSLDSHLGKILSYSKSWKSLFPGMESCRNALMNDINESRHENHHISSKKKMGRPKGQHSAPRGGPPRSWTNAELTEALSHVWNKKMTTSQASRIFGIPYNSLLMYVRGKYGKSLKLEQLKKECFGDIGGPLDLLGLGSLAANNNNQTVKSHKGPEPDLMLGPPGFNASSYPTANFYPDFSSSFPVPVGMVHLLPQSEKNRDSSPTRALAIDYAKEESNQRLRSTPIDYTKDDSLRNSPIKDDYHNSMDGEEEMDASPRSNHEMTPQRLIEQNGKD